MFELLEIVGSIAVYLAFSGRSDRKRKEYDATHGHSLYALQDARRMRSKYLLGRKKPWSFHWFH